jgi:hypothetical protein
MTMLAVTVLDARPSAQTAAPGITFGLRIENISATRVHAIALRCQVRIEPRGRRYAEDEQQRLYELFGEVSQWDRTLHGVTWSQSTLIVPSFERRIDVELPVACTYDLEVASAKYLHAVRAGDVPLLFMFSGTVFAPADRSIHADPAAPALSGLAMEPVSWDLDASFRMPAQVWRAAMDQFFPGGGWVRLSRETLDRLQAFRGKLAVVGWDEAIDRLLEHARSEEAV